MFPSLFNSNQTTIIGLHKIDRDQLANMTHQQLAELFPQEPENISSLVNSIVFLISYMMVMSIMTSILIKYWKQMKRNQKAIYLLVFICIFQQSIGLLLRVCYNSYSFWMNTEFADNYTKIDDMQGRLITLAMLSLVESLAVYGQGVTVIVVVAY